jgi:transposase-like protein
MTTITTELEEQKRDRQGRRITPAARRAELVEGYRASGLTMEQFARREGINRLTLAKWCHLHGRGAGPRPMNFTEVKLGPPGPVSWAFELMLPNGWVVRAADASALAQLLHVTR